MSDLRTLIEQLLAIRPGEQFKLGYDGDGGWDAEFVNPVTCVALGESAGVFYGTGKTPEEAVQNCISKAAEGE